MMKQFSQKQTKVNYFFNKMNKMRRDNKGTKCKKQQIKTKKCQLFLIKKMLMLVCPSKIVFTLEIIDFIS